MRALWIGSLIDLMGVSVMADLDELIKSASDVMLYWRAKARSNNRRFTIRECRETYNYYKGVHDGLITARDRINATKTG